MTGKGDRYRQLETKWRKYYAADFVMSTKQQKTILNYVKQGNTLQTACLAAGMTVKKLDQMLGMAKGLFYKQKYGGDLSIFQLELLEFKEKLDIAMAETEARFVEIISKAGENDWKAAQFWLESMKSSAWYRPKGNINIENNVQQNNIQVVSVQGVDVDLI